MYQFKQRAVLATLLIACTMHLQAFEVTVSVNGKDIITPVIEQVQETSSALVTSGLQMLDTLFTAVETTYIPLVSYTDKNMNTFYINAADVAFAWTVGMCSVPLFMKAADLYRESKICYNGEDRKALAKLYAACGLTVVGLAGTILYQAEKKITFAPM